MGRSFLSVRQGVNIIAERWERVARRYRGAKRMPELARSYSSEGFMGCNDPLESALFSALVAMDPDRNTDESGENLCSPVGNRTPAPEPN